MKCPVCSRAMVEKDFGGVKVEVCSSGCKGLFFEWCELRKLDEKNEGVGQALSEALNSPRHKDKDRPQLTCPKCGMKMCAHKYPSSHELNVDECYGCGAFFLDAGELSLVRDSYMTDSEHDAYTKKLIEEIPGFKNAKTAEFNAAARTEAVINYTKFLSGYLSKGR